MPATKSKTVFVCSQCGYESPRYFGKCPGCGEWNTLEEQVISNTSKSNSKSEHTNTKSLQLNDIECLEDDHRYKTSFKEFDRVLGGGIVKGSIVLLSGDPGIGKSTILLQISESLGKGQKILYVSGEESAHQIKIRADRLSVKTENIYILCETDVQLITEHIKSEKPDLVIIDSIQTMNFSELSSYPGSVAQVRECTNYLAQTAKSMNIAMILVGHVNKDGNIAGPKVLEHIVDCVLYFEGERNLSYRILRAIKNRYGSTNEIGVFEMLDSGLSEVENPSLMLISGRPKNTSGTCIACVMEGSRPILAEIQGLVTPTGFGNPRRMSTGFDHNRLSLILAVLEKRCGYFFGNMDTYINVIGGIKLDEPSSDLSVALALISSLKDCPIPDNVLAFGEIGLGGEIRSVNSCEQRVKEAARLGFERCVIPRHNLKNIPESLKKEIEIIGAKSIRDAFEAIV